MTYTHEYNMQYTHLHINIHNYIFLDTFFAHSKAFVCIFLYVQYTLYQYQEVCVFCLFIYFFSFEEKKAILER